MLALKVVFHSSDEITCQQNNIMSELQKLYKVEVCTVQLVDTATTW